MQARFGHIYMTLPAEIDIDRLTGTNRGICPIIVDPDNPALICTRTLAPSFPGEAASLRGVGTALFGRYNLTVIKAEALEWDEVEPRRSSTC